MVKKRTNIPLPPDPTVPLFHQGFTQDAAQRAEDHYTYAWVRRLDPIILLAALFVIGLGVTYYAIHC